MGELRDLCRKLRAARKTIVTTMGSRERISARLYKFVFPNYVDRHYRNRYCIGG
jgi:hypothetical protein